MKDKKPLPAPAQPATEEQWAKVFENEPKAGGGLLRVIVQVGPRRFDEDLAEQAVVRPNIEALNDALSRHASRFAEWAMLEALARTEVDAIKSQISRLDTDVKEIEARLYQEVILATPRGEKPPTVDAIKAMVLVNSARLELVARERKLEDALLVADDNLRKLAVGRKTMEEKKDSLLELSRNWRQEMAGKLQVNMDQFRPGGRS
jgi:hypothetical protein